MKNRTVTAATMFGGGALSIGYNYYGSREEREHSRIGECQYIDYNSDVGEAAIMVRT